MTYVFVGRNFPGFSQLSVYSHKGKTRDALKGRDLADHDCSKAINDAVLFERTER